MNSAWKPILKNLEEIAFPLEVSGDTVLHARRAGKFGEMRAAIRRTVETIRQPLGATQSAQLASQLTRATKAMYKEGARSAKGFRLEGRLAVSVPSGGFERTDVQRLLVTFGRARTVTQIPMALFARVNLPKGSGDE